MDLCIADTFTTALTRLPAQDQKAAKTSAFDLRLDPTSPSLQMHRIDRSKDPNFWSVRASRDVRIVVHKTASSLLLAYVDHHDAAYAWARRRRIEAHPRTGAIQIVEVRELVEEIEPNLAFGTRNSSALESPRLFEHLTSDELLAVGVPADWLDDVGAATVDTFDGLEAYLPSEAHYALLSYAVEGVLQIPVPVSSALVFGTAAVQPHLRIIQDAEELRHALDEPIGPWSSIRRDGFRRFLMGDFRGARTGRPLTRRAADSYCSYVARVENTLEIDLDEMDLGAAGVALIEDRLRSSQAKASMPDSTLSSCVSGLRTYARYRNAAHDPAADASNGSFRISFSIRPETPDRAGFLDFLMSDKGKSGAGGPMTSGSAHCYCSYINQLEGALETRLDEEDLSETGVAVIVNRLLARNDFVNLPTKTISNLSAGLRAYARYRRASAVP